MSDDVTVIEDDIKTYADSTGRVKLEYEADDF